MNKTTTQSPSMGKIAQHRRPSLWLAIPIVMALTVVWTNANYPLDYWLHINNGQWMVEHRALIQHDTYSHTIDGQEISNQPWLAQIAMYRLHRVGGYALNQFVAAFGYALGVATVIWLVARRCGNWTLAAFAGCVSVALISTNVGVRPQYFSVILFSAQFLLLLRARRMVTICAGCFCVTALWTNLHGAYPLGVIVPSVFLAAALIEKLTGSPLDTVLRLKRFASATATSILGCFVRPVPSDTIGYVTNCSSASVERGLVEWLPTSWNSTSGTLFFSSVALLLCILCLSRRRTEAHELLLLAAFFVLACTSQRMILWWALVMPVALSRPADQVWRHTIRWFHRLPSIANSSESTPPTRIDRLAGMVVLSCIIAFAAFSTPWTRKANACLPPTKRVDVLNGEPLNLVQYLEKASLFDGQPKRSFAPLPWGSYFSWYSQGKLKSFLDTRVDFFPAEVWNAYQQIISGSEKSLELLDQYQVDVVACEVDQDGLISRLQSSGKWNELYADHIGMIFTRL